MAMNKEISILLQRMIGKPDAIRLINAYKSLHITYPATLIKIEEDVVCVQSEKLQILCASYEGSTYLQWQAASPLFKARVREVDFIKNQVFLTDFAYETGNIGIRAQVRVKPNETTIALVHKTEDDESNVCEIADLSLDGIGLRLAENVFKPEVFSLGTKLTVHFCLPIEMDSSIQERVETMPYLPPLEKDYRLFHLLYIPAPLMNYPSIWGKIASMREVCSRGCTFQGMIMYIIHDHTNHTYRLGMRLDPNRLERQMLSKYIVQRQTEIIHEIRQTQDAIYRLISNEDVKFASIS